MPRRLIAASSLCLALALLVPAASIAALYNFGSNLGEKATVAYPHGADTAFWSTALGSGAQAKAPKKGQIYAIRVRGCAERGTGGQLPLTQVHFQVLVPSGGAVKIAVTSGPENMPICGGNVNGSTISTFHPLNLCVHAGNYVAFNDEGGFAPGFPSGVNYEILAPDPGASTASFTGANMTNNGSVLTASPHAGVELLMQLVLATGKNAVGVCR